MSNAAPLPQDPNTLLEQALEGIQEAACRDISASGVQRWFETLGTAVAQARPRIASYANSQEGLLEQVTLEEVELRRHIEHLCDRLEDLRVGFEALRSRVSVEAEANQSDSRRQPAALPAESMRQLVLEWLVRAWEHGAAVDAWLQGRLYRDRGNA